MREVLLYDSVLVALVDNEDFEHLATFRWYAKNVPDSDIVYAYRQERRNGISKMIFMHREIVMATSSDIFVDHRDHNGLNNQRANLRFATKSQNQGNRRLDKRSSTGFKGVNFIPRLGKWGARIHMNEKRHWLGTFSTPTAAAAAYDEAARHYFGEFAKTNL